MIVTVTESLWIERPPDVVWDFTQDYDRRAEWDPEVLSAEVIQSVPRRRIRIRGRGGLRGVLEYKLFDRPRRTSVALTEVRSLFVEGGGGSWTYEPKNAGTEWTQTNTVRLKNRLVFWLFASFARHNLERSTRLAMTNAKRLLEGPAIRH